jgi:hypothetical protein
MRTSSTPSRPALRAAALGRHTLYEVGGQSVIANPVKNDLHQTYGFLWRDAAQSQVAVHYRNSEKDCGGRHPLELRTGSDRVANSRTMKVTSESSSKTVGVTAGMPTGFGMVGKYSNTPARNGTTSRNTSFTRPATHAKGRQRRDANLPRGTAGR